MSVVEWRDEQTVRCYEKSPQYAWQTHAHGFGGTAPLMRNMAAAVILFIEDVTSGEKYG
jgi:hypothetical protein